MSVNSLKIIVIIPAAGTGHRFGDSSTPKQYSIVCDKPLIYHTINAFLRFLSITELKFFQLFLSFVFN
jgi:2-C-methyl-D-erythritol 4-phosphate cytidylyltransferase